MLITIVFDGAPLPSKEGTEVERARTRADALAKALEYEELGERSLAQSHFARALDVTPHMAFEVSEALKAEGVNIVVAPYEADAQLGYLSRNGFVDIVISEDSDLILFGCKRLLYKLDFKTEIGKELLCDDVFAVSGFSRLSRESFLLTAILAGCDYLPSVASVGIKTAISLGAKAEGILSSSHHALDSDAFLDKLVVLIRLSGVDEASLSVNFKDQVKRAILTFRHQTVFCPTRRRLLPLSSEEVDHAFCGARYDAETACSVADCLVHPETKQPFERRIDDTPQPTKTLARGNKENRGGSKKQRIQEPIGSRLVDMWQGVSKHEPVIHILDNDVTERDSKKKYRVTRVSIDDLRKSGTDSGICDIDSLRFTSR